jgi:hypothetical protein
VSPVSNLVKLVKLVIAGQGGWLRTRVVASIQRLRPVCL